MKNFIFCAVFGSYFSTFWVNAGIYSLILHIQSNCWKKIAPEKSSKHGYFLRSGQIHFFGLEGRFLDVQC